MAFTWTETLAQYSIITKAVIDEIRDNVDYVDNNPAACWTNNSTVESSKDSTVQASQNSTVESSKDSTVQATNNTTVDSDNTGYAASGNTSYCSAANSGLQAYDSAVYNPNYSGGGSA